MRRVNRRTRRLTRRCHAAAANSGILILLVRFVGCCINDCLLLLVPIAGGLAIDALAAVLDLVLAAGCSSLRALSIVALRLSLPLRRLLAFVLPIRISVWLS